MATRHVTYKYANGNKATYDRLNEQELIKKIDKTVADNVTITFAAAGAFTATWNNRGSETYS